MLVVDDSAYLRKVVCHMLRQSPNLEVVGTARDGAEALAKLQTLQPDVITLDLHMPEMDGVAFLRAMMRRDPRPVVVVSIASEDGRLAGEAAELGAVDFVRKPTGLANEQVLTIQAELIAKVLAAACVPRSRLLAPRSSGRLAIPSTLSAEAVVIGLSTGGPQALRYLVSQLPGDFPVPLAAVLHMPVGYTGPFAERLNAGFPLEVVEAEPGLEWRPGRLILAKAGWHLRPIRLGEAVVCSLERLPESPHIPAVDVLFQGAGDVYGGRLVAAVFTGMGRDGTAGAAWIKARGGKVAAEHESSCAVYGMPRSVIEAGLADVTAPLTEMPAAISSLL